MGGTGLFGWLGDSLFGASPYAPTQRAPNITPDPPGGYGGPGSLAGLLDPQGARQQAAWAGLGALSQGLLAAGMRRPAGSPSPLPQAFGAFQPAYQGALQSNLQTQAAQQQMEQQQRQQQAFQSYIAGLPAGTQRQMIEAAGPSALPGLIQAQARQGRLGTPAEHAAAGVPMGNLYFTADGQPHVLSGPVVAGLTAAATRDPVLTTPEGPVLRSAYPGAGGTAPQPGGAQPGGAPSGQPATPGDTRAAVGIRNNNWLSMSPGGRVAQYETPEIGVAAASQNLDRLFPSGTVTPRQLVQTWAQGPNYDPARAAPGIRASVENYGTAVARAAGVSNPDQPINLRDPATRLRVMQAMGQFETGGLPQGAEAVLARGIALAAQPGAGFTPTMPRQVAQAGGPVATVAAATPAPQSPPIPSLIPDRTGATAVPPTLPQGGDGDLVLRRQPGALLTGPTPQQITQAREFSNHFIGIPEVRNTLRVTTVLSAMEDAAPRGTAASDLNLVYGLMTILDPGSVVRDSETGMVQATQSAPARLTGLIDRLVSGGATLGSEGRRAIMEEARGRVQTQVATYNSLHGREASLVRSANLNPNVVLGPRATMPQPARAPEPPPVLPPTSAATPTARPDAPAPQGTGRGIQPPPPPPPPPLPPNTARIPIPPAGTLGMMSITQIAPYASRIADMDDDQRRAVEQVIAREEARIRGER